MKIPLDKTVRINTGVHSLLAKIPVHVYAFRQLLDCIQRSTEIKVLFKVTKKMIRVRVHVFSLLAKFYVHLYAVHHTRQLDKKIRWG